MENSLAALIFSGDLSLFLPQGIGMMLVGTVIVTIFLTLVSFLGNMIGVRSASVKAGEPSNIYRLSSENFRTMQKEDPALAFVFHEWIALTLAERLSENNRLI